MEIKTKFPQFGKLLTFALRLICNGNANEIFPRKEKHIFTREYILIEQFCDVIRFRQYFSQHSIYVYCSKSKMVTNSQQYFWLIANLLNFY